MVPFEKGSLSQQTLLRIDGTVYVDLFHVHCHSGRHFARAQLFPFQYAGAAAFYRLAKLFTPVPGGRCLLIALKNTLLFAVITGPVSYIACFLFAWIINELSPKIRAVMTLVFYAPSISGNVFFIWLIIFSGDSYGYMNGFLMRLGVTLEPIQWLADERYVLAIVIIVQLWLSLGTSFLAFIAGLQTIDRSLVEAGTVDGIKNRWQELWYITLPSMRPQLMFGAVMQITASFAVAEISIALAGFPSVNYAAHTVVTHLMDFGTIRFEMGYASAIATVLFALMLGTNILTQKMLRKIGE